MAATNTSSSQVELFVLVQTINSPYFNQYINLDLNLEEKIKVTLSVSDVADPTVNTSTFSQSFTLPNTNRNFQFFQDAYSVNGTMFDPSNPVSAYINVNGVLFQFGILHLETVHKDLINGSIEYDVVFIGAAGSFSNAVGGAVLSDLNLGNGIFINGATGLTGFIGPNIDLRHTFNTPNAILSWQANGSEVLGLAGASNSVAGDILYPLVEWGYDYSGDNTPINVQAVVADGQFTTAGNYLNLEQLKPAIRAKVIWDEIFLEAGWSYNSKFLNTDFFRRLYILSDNTSEAQLSVDNLWDDVMIFQNWEDMTLLSPVSATAANALDQSGNTLFDVKVYGFGWAINDPNNLVKQGPYGGQLIPNTTSSVGNLYSGFLETWQATWGIYDPNADNTNYTIGIIDVTYIQQELNNSSTPPQPQCLISGEITIPNPNYSIPVDISFTTLGLTAGNIYQVIIGFSDFTSYASHQAGPALSQIKVNNLEFSTIGGPNSTYNPQQFLPADIKQIDFIKSINNKFKLQWTPGGPEFNDGNLTSNTGASTILNYVNIEPWVDWIEEGNKLDWTEKLDLSKDFQTKPAFYTQPRIIETQDSEDSDLVNYQWQANFKHPYGWQLIDSGNLLQEGSNKIETIFAPTPLYPIEISNDNVGGFTANNGWFFPHLTKIEQGGQPDNSTTNINDKLVPIRPKPRLVFYNGLYNNPLNYFAGGEPLLWNLNDNLNVTGSTAILSYYPLVSSYENWLLGNANTLLGPATAPGADPTQLQLDWTSPGGVYNVVIPITLNNFTQPYYNNNMIVPQQNTVWGTYWQSWYNLMYNPRTNIATGYFKLSYDDIQQLQFNDKIWLQNAYWQPLKIYDYPIGEVANVKVDLLQLTYLIPNSKPVCNCQTYGIFKSITNPYNVQITSCYDGEKYLVPINNADQIVSVCSCSLIENQGLLNAYTIQITPNGDAPCCHSITIDNTNIETTTLIGTNCNGDTVTIVVPGLDSSFGPTCVNTLTLIPPGVNIINGCTCSPYNLSITSLTDVTINYTDCCTGLFDQVTINNTSGAIPICSCDSMATIFSENGADNSGNVTQWSILAEATPDIPCVIGCGSTPCNQFLLTNLTGLTQSINYTDCIGIEEGLMLPPYNYQYLCVCGDAPTQFVGPTFSIVPMGNCFIY